MSAEQGNKYAQQWTLENATPRFEDALQFAETDETCLSLQDAIYYSGIPYSTFDYLAENQEVLGQIKRDIKQAVIRRINRNALDKVTPSPASPAIWRMKQLGERDEQHINQNTTGSTTVVVRSKDDQQAIDELKQRFQDE